jgi:hypothetical protein
MTLRERRSGLKSNNVHFDLTHLSTGQVALIGAAATVSAAIIASVAALTVAVVNHYAARRLALITTKREYFKSVLEPFLVRLEADVPPLMRLVQLQNRRALRFSDTGMLRQTVIESAVVDDAEKDGITRNLYRFGLTPLDDLPAPIRSILDSEPDLQIAFLSLTQARADCDVEGHILDDAIAAKKLDEIDASDFKNSVNNTVELTFRFRQAAERFLFK